MALELFLLARHDVISSDVTGVEGGGEWLEKESEEGGRGARVSKIEDDLENFVITYELPPELATPVVIRENLFPALNRLKIRGSATWLWRRSLSIFYAFTDPSKSFSFSPPNGLADSLPRLELIFMIRFWLGAKNRI